MHNSREIRSLTAEDVATKAAKMQTINDVFIAVK